MARDPAPSGEEIEAGLRRVGRYSRLVRAGLLVVLLAFALSLVGVLPANLESPSQAIASIRQPLTFAGIALILYGIGMHLHLLHLNVVRQLEPQEAERAAPDDGEHDSRSATDERNGRTRDRRR